MPLAWYLPGGPFTGMCDDSRLFGPVTHKSSAWSLAYAIAGFAALMTSKSYPQVLPAQQREALVGDLAAAIEAEGGALEMQYETHLYLAQPRG